MFENKAQQAFSCTMSLIETVAKLKLIKDDPLGNVASCLVFYMKMKEKYGYV